MTPADGAPHGPGGLLERPRRGARFGLLGIVEVRDDDGSLVDLGGAQPRKVLSVLLAAGGRVVPFAAMVDAVWGEAAPPGATSTLHAYVSRLRRALEPGRQPRHAARVLVTEPHGYRLVLDPEDLDATRFEALADAGRDALAAGRPADAARVLRRAEELWRGPVFAEHRDEDWARGVATRLDERRLAVREQRLTAELALGHVAEVAAEAAQAVREAPLREGRWVTLALALYRSDRQGEALRAIDEARRTLADELGLEPGASLRDLERDILAHAPGLHAPEPARRIDVRDLLADVILRALALLTEGDPEVVRALRDRAGALSVEQGALAVARQVAETASLVAHP